MSRLRKKAEDYNRVASERGFKWLGSNVPRTDEKTLWMCNKGHTWKATYTNVRRGNGCPFCAGKKNEDDYIALASGRGFEWADAHIPQNTGYKTEWRCSEGHTWEATYSQIQQGRGCPFCRAYQPGDYERIAGSFGFEWLGPYTGSIVNKTWFRCEHGHEWETRFRIVKDGHGCPVCKGIEFGKRHWKGGISFEPYPVEFNEKLKTGIRERDRLTCAVCRLRGKDVHHIDYDKDNCNLDNLITLCRSCHSTTNYNRKYWETELRQIVKARILRREVPRNFSHESMRGLSTVKSTAPT